MTPGHPIKIKKGPISKEEYAMNIGVLSNLEMIRVNQFQVFQEFLEQSSGSDTTSEKLTFPQFKPGFVYIITHISAINTTDAAHQIRIGVTLGGKDLVVESSTVANTGDSVEYVGQLFLKEGDKVFAEFRSIGASDNIKVFMNGYKIRR